MTHPPRAALAPEEIERLSEPEHERWVAERESAGRRPGPRDVDHRTTPDLVPRSRLPEQAREYDRLSAQRLPRLLATIGLQVLPRQDR